MLENLSASVIPRRLEPTRVMLAAALHGLIIVGAIRGTAANDVLSSSRPIALVEYHAPPVPRTEASQGPGAEAGLAARPSGTFQPAPLSFSPDIPSITLEPAIGLSAIRRLALPGSGAVPSQDKGAAGIALFVAEVDEPAVVLHQPSPRYPPVLRQAGLEGKVLLEFIIDTTGHPEVASLRIVERTRPGFDAAARETIERSLFRPARVHGRAVRQRTLQAIVFRLLPE